MMLKIAIGSGTNLGKVKNVEMSWEELKQKLTTHKIQKDKKKAPFIVGGYFDGSARREESMKARTLMIFDCDDVGMSVDDLEAYLMGAIDCAFVAYSTYSHTSQEPRIRVVVPLAQEVGLDTYRFVSKRFCDELDALKFDDCSYSPNHLMYAPRAEALDDVWSCSKDGDFYLIRDNFQEKNLIESDDLETMVAMQPVGLDDIEIQNILDGLGADYVDDYHEWMKVGAAIHHEFEGSDAGLKVFDKWSQSGVGYKGLDDVTKTYNSFRPKSKPITLRSYMHKSAVETREDVVEEAHRVASVEDFEAFRESLRGRNYDDLTMSMIINALTKGFGKECGLGKTDIKKALVVNTKTNLPDFAKHWVYVESQCIFFNTKLNYGIKREAFDAKYADETSVKALSTTASHLALSSDDSIDKVVDLMFWPGIDERFEYEGKGMLNTYREHKVKLRDDQVIVDRFIQHLENTIADSSERKVFLDWLCYVCQNPGQRVNWAVVLQGCQGTGKTYFVNVLQAVIGHNLSCIEPRAVTGDFTGWATGSTVIAIEEIRISGSNKYEVLDRMKPFVTNDTVAIQEKYKAHRAVPNFTSYMMLTNHPDAIPIDDSDRRYCVFYSKWQTAQAMHKDLGGVDEAVDYFDALFGDLREDKVGAIAQYILTREISKDFKPKGRAPKTAAREAMVAFSVSTERQAVEDAIERHSCFAISNEVLDLTYLNSLIKMDEQGDEFPKNRVLTKVLLEMGYRQIKNRRIKFLGVQRYIWFKDIDETAAIETVRSFHEPGDENLPF